MLKNTLRKQDRFLEQLFTRGRRTDTCDEQPGGGLSPLQYIAMLMGYQDVTATFSTRRYCR